jgi:galactokinase/galacturonokinase
MLQSFPSVSEQVSAATAVLLNTFTVDPSEIRQIFMPYRICPLGAHVDHQGGHVLGRIINTGTVLVYVPIEEAEVHLASTNFPDPIRFTIGADINREHWARYAQAAALALNQEYPLSMGFAGVSSGTLIGAGLSSSAAVGLAYLQALADVNNIYLSDTNMVELDYQLEHTYLGLKNGILDQSSILFGQKNALVYIDTRFRQMNLIPDPPQTGEVGWLIVHSGVNRELTKGGGYNRNVLECREAAGWLSPDAVVLSDVPQEVFFARANEMPDNLRHRANHYFGEVARVSEGVQAWKENDVPRFGRLMNESCASSIHEYGSGQDEVIALHQIVSEATGVYGSRFSGAGHGGVVIGLVELAQAETAASEIMQSYRELFPALAENAGVFLVENGFPL